MMVLHLLMGSPVLDNSKKTLKMLAGLPDTGRLPEQYLLEADAAYPQLVGYLRKWLVVDVGARREQTLGYFLSCSLFGEMPTVDLDKHRVNAMAAAAEELARVFSTDISTQIKSLESKSLAQMQAVLGVCRNTSLTAEAIKRQTRALIEGSASSEA